MFPQAQCASDASARRTVHLRLLIFALVVVASGMTLTYFGKFSTTTQLPTSSIDINTTDFHGFRNVLGVDERTAEEIVSFRQHLPHREFASTYILHRLLEKHQDLYLWNWQRLYARTWADVALHYFSAMFLLAALSLGVHALLRRVAPTFDPFLFPIAILLSGFGLMASFSVHDPLRDTFAFDNQAFGVTICGLFALLVPLLKTFRTLPLHRYTYAYAAGAFLLLAMLMVLGRGPAATHIELFGFEPIEFIKVLLVFFIASYLADRRMGQRDRITRRSYLPSVRDTLPLMAIYVFALLLFGAVKDLGPAVLLFGTFVAMLYLVTGNPLYPFIGFVLLLVAGYIGDRLGIGFFATRVEMWLHPWDNANRLGGQLAQGIWGLATGGIFGSGLGLGGSSFVPRAGSDMVFTTVGEETGFVGALCLLALYVIVIFRGFKIALDAIDDFDRLVAAGITILLGLQALVIAGGATGVMPLTGITLPFVAYGTSSLVANFFCIGVLLSISGKRTGADISAAPPQVFRQTARSIAVSLSGALLLLVGVARLGWLQGVDDVSVATHDLRIPDADNVVRDHRNPRLEAYAAAIVRGKIRDRNGIVLAENAAEGSGIPYLADGIARIYPLGPIGADIVYAVEQPVSSTNPLGCDTTLRGYSTLDDLLPLYQRKDLPFPPTPDGSDVTLSLDIGLQKVAQAAVERSAVKYGDGRGAAVVLDCKTGALLAAATAPTFDPSLLTDSSWAALHTAADPSQPLLNRAFAGDYPPGSVFKLVTATAAFQQNKSSLIFNCDHMLPEIRWRFNGENYVRRNITDDEEFIPHGTTDIAKAIRVSCNVYFAQLGVALGAAPLERVINSYGLHACPNVDLLGADLPDCAYGQGTILVTPYQMARVCQTIANYGVLAAPNFLLHGGADGSSRRLLTAEDARSLGQMMQGVVTDGTGAGLFSGMSVAGKTGSAQLDRGRPHSWFVGFAPVENPSIAFACVIEHGGHGRTAAGPVCEDIVNATLR